MLEIFEFWQVAAICLVTMFLLPLIFYLASNTGGKGKTAKKQAQVRNKQSNNKAKAARPKRAKAAGKKENKPPQAEGGNSEQGKKGAAGGDEDIELHRED
jgi:hypothetical protein